MDEKDNTSSQFMLWVTAHTIYNQLRFDSETQEPSERKY